MMKQEAKTPLHLYLSYSVKAFFSIFGGAVDISLSKPAYTWQYSLFSLEINSVLHQVLIQHIYSTLCWQGDWQSAPKMSPAVNGAIHKVLLLCAEGK